ncbi:hypothetical protein KBA63_01895 [Candidatus Woesebacteria bacterium]|jgi:flagellar basal body-associated protein FliL|nr:hypothetical protein [Candidatus Woesebacteria bacterium]MBP9687509.1 hypothetical protein [Candidatus Woesebacteria bacterium]
MKRNTGFAHIILIVMFVVVALGVVGYYAMSQKGMMGTYQTESTVTPMPSLSPANDVTTIQKEFDQTELESVDTEFSSISAQVKGL